MKRLFCTLICLVVGTFPLYAQGLKGKTVVEGSKKISEAASKKLPSGMVNVGKLTTGGATGNAVQHSSQMAKIGKQAKVSTRSTVDHSTNVTHLSAKGLRRPSGSKIPDKIKVEKQQNEMLERQLAKVQAAIQANKETHAAQTFSADFGRSVLFAPVEGKGKIGGFSVTAIQIEHQGEKEIFGIIASHVLPESYYTLSASLQRNFHINIANADGSVISLPAEVVQISPQSMLDISLVKFSPEAEKLLRPLELSEVSAGEGEKLFSTGFGAGARQEEFRTVQKKSFLSVQTDQNLTGERQGFCGSPLVDANGKVKAIHTGTKEMKNALDVSYGAHAHFVRLLVDAYYNDGHAMYDLEINGQTFARLNVDEYISAIYLYDGNGKRLLQKNIEDKFSQSFLERSLQENPQATYVQLTTRKAQWEVDGEGDSILKEDRSRSDKTKRQHWYNLLTHQMEPTRPAVIKM